MKHGCMLIIINFRKEKASQDGVNGWEKQIDLYDFRA